MQRHQRDARSFVVVVAVRDQRCAVQKLRQGFAATLCGGGGIDEFSEILGPALRLRRVLELQDAKIIRALENALEKPAHGEAAPLFDERAHHRVEALQHLQRPGRQAFFEQGLLQGFPQRELPLPRRFLDHSHGRISDAARRSVQDARQRRGIAQIARQARVRQHVLDFRSGVKAEAADHAVVDAAPPQRLFQHPRLSVGAIQDGDRAVWVRTQVARDLARHKPGFLLGGLRLKQADRVPEPAIGPQGLAFAGFVAADEGARGIKDDLRRAVVLLQANDSGAGVILLEPEDVLDCGAPPAINRLVFVPHHTEVLLLAG